MKSHRRGTPAPGVTPSRRTVPTALAAALQHVRALVAPLLALTVALATVVIIAQPANAVQGINSTLLKNGSPVSSGATLTEGDELVLRVQYDESVGGGTVVEFEFDATVGDLSVPAGNDAIESVTRSGNLVTVTFKDPWPVGIDQGIFDLKMEVSEVQKSSIETITWMIDDEENSVPVTILNRGDQPADVNAERFAKRLNNADRPAGSPLVWPSNRVSVSNGVVTVAPGILGDTLTYRLEVDTPNGASNRTNFEITDQLPAGLSYVADSFTASLTSWDADGLNRQVTSPAFAPTITGNAFSGRVDLPAPSRYTVSYQVKVADDAARLALQAALQVQYDALVAGTPGHGNFEVQLNNTAEFGGEVTRTAHARLRGNLPNPHPGPDLGSAFAKTANWSTRNVEADADGNLITPEPLTYTLRADLTRWDNDGTNPNRVLGDNVVIRDVLPAQATWDATAADFLTTTGRGAAGAGNLALTEASTCPATVADFRSDAFVGTWCVDGQTLLVNVGKDDTTNVDIAAKVLINSVEGLPVAGNTSITDATPYRLRNRAEFHHGTGSPYTRDRDVTVVVLPDTTDGYNDETVFAKTGVPAETVVDPGESTTVRYTFRVAAGNGIDMRNSYLVDHLQPGLFELPGDLTDVIVDSSYNGVALSAGHYVVTRVGDDLRFELNPIGKLVVDSQPVDREWRLVIDLPTRPIGDAGPPKVKETLEIQNRATLHGSDEEPLFWSEHRAESTSYGDEAEVRKRVFSPWEEEWVPTLTAYVDTDGALVTDTYTYRVEFLPHGNYNNVAIVPVDDVLPAGVTFLGFVSEANAGTGNGASMGPVDIGGNLEATYDAGTNTVTLRQKAGTRLIASQEIAAYFSVQVDNVDQVLEPIVNSAGGSTAIIEPGEEPSIDIEKWTDDGSAPAYDAAGNVTNDGYAGDYDGADESKLLVIGTAQEIRFTVSNNGGEDLRDIEVTDALVSGSGEVTGLRCDFPGSAPAGTTWSGPFQTGTQFECTATLTLDDFAQTHRDEAAVHAVGLHTGVPVADDDPWQGHARGKSVTVGDYVWIDQDRDGRQDAGEPGVGDVLLEVVGPDGPVVDVFGVPVTPQRTDADGRYLFEDLPALSGDETYTVRIVHGDQQTDDALAPYVPAPQGRGDRGGDSSTDEASTLPGELHEDGEADLTLDFGFIQKSYAVGDVAWIDRDRNDVQDDGELPLVGVLVELLDADGESVTDVLGATVEPTRTDAAGRYVFDNLPAGDYRVRFTLTDEQAAYYEFVAPGVGTDDLDSDAVVDADPAVGLSEVFTLDDANGALTTTYDRDLGATQGIDPTWDAGVVAKRVSIGDYVWLDEDRDGRQGDDEPGLPGVVLKVVGPDGEPVVDVFGNPVGPETTDGEGRYHFTDLPVLTGDDTYRVVIDRDASAAVLKPYAPAPSNVGDREQDSSLWEALTEPGGLAVDGAEDLTLDFGFVTKSYAIGDYVWIDANSNGVQDRDEKPLAGVTVELLDGDGVVIATQVTDKGGRYLFDDLAAGTYRVRFTLTDQQAAKYAFTKAVAGRDAGVDSDAAVGTNPAVGISGLIVLGDDNAALTTAYDRDLGATEGVDPTWDAGVIVLDLSGVSGDGASGDKLPGVGSTIGLGTLLLALGLILGGGLLLLVRRRFDTN